MQEVLSEIRTLLASIEPVRLLAVGAGLGLVLALLCAAAVAIGRGLARRGSDTDAFQAIAAEALRRNNEGFLALAAERFRALQEASSNDLDGRHKAIADLVSPLQQTIAGFQQEAQRLERERVAQAGRVSEQLRDLAHRTGQLTTALRAPGARGRWGELTLRRTVELAGLAAHCDFAEQVTLGSGRGALRPDLVVQLPSGRALVVDAKAPLDAYLDASGASCDAERDRALERHARQVRRHADTLASRGYAERLARTPEFVVLFLPHEGFLAAAVERDPGLVADMLARGVVVATPATLFALLAAVGKGWREQALAENTQHILGLAREMHDRLGVFSQHLTRLGASLSGAVEHFNATVGSLETRVLVQARRLRELGVSDARSLDAPPAIDVATRRPAAPDAGGAAAEDEGDRTDEGVAAEEGGDRTDRSTAAKRATV